MQDQRTFELYQQNWDIMNIHEIFNPDIVMILAEWNLSDFHNVSGFCGTYNKIRLVFDYTLVFTSFWHNNITSLSKVRRAAREQLFTPALKIAEDAILESSGPDTVSLPKKALLKRVVNRTRAKLCPEEPRTLDFQVCAFFYRT